MDNNKIIKLAAAGFVGLVWIPMVTKGIMVGGAYMVEAIDKMQATIRYKRKIRKGLKDGSVIEIDGQYFEVQTVEEA
jgi:hypothetical protein